MSQKFYKIRCKSRKITKRQFLLANSWAVNPNLGVLGLDLHSPTAPSLLISSGHSSRLGGTILVWGAQAVIWGGTDPECPPWRRAWDRTISRTCRLRGQGLELRGQGQELKNVSSRRSLRPRTYSRTPPLEKNGLEVELGNCEKTKLFLT